MLRIIIFLLFCFPSFGQFKVLVVDEANALPNIREISEITDCKGDRIVNKIEEYYLSFEKLDKFNDKLIYQLLKMSDSEIEFRDRLPSEINNEIQRIYSFNHLVLISNSINEEIVITLYNVESDSVWDIKDSFSRKKFRFLERSRIGISHVEDIESVISNMLLKIHDYHCNLYKIKSKEGKVKIQNDTVFLINSENINISCSLKIDSFSINGTSDFKIREDSLIIENIDQSTFVHILMKTRSNPIKVKIVIIPLSYSNFKAPDREKRQYLINSLFKKKKFSKLRLLKIRLNADVEDYTIISDRKPKFNVKLSDAKFTLGGHNDLKNYLNSLNDIDTIILKAHSSTNSLDIYSLNRHNYGFSGRERSFILRNNKYKINLDTISIRYSKYIQHYSLGIKSLITPYNRHFSYLPSLLADYNFSSYFGVRAQIDYPFNQVIKAERKRFSFDSNSWWSAYILIRPSELIESFDRFNVDSRPNSFKQIGITSFMQIGITSQKFEISEDFFPYKRVYVKKENSISFGGGIEFALKALKIGVYLSFIEPQFLSQINESHLNFSEMKFVPMETILNIGISGTIGKYEYAERYEKKIHDLLLRY